MSIGVLLSTIATFVLNGKLARFQLIASICMTIGSSFYLVAFRTSTKTTPKVLTAAFFVIGTLLIVMDFTQGA